MIFMKDLGGFVKTSLAIVICTIIMAGSIGAKQSGGNWAEVEAAFNGKIDGGSLDAIEAIKLHSANHAVVLTLPLGSVDSHEAFSERSIEALPGSRIFLSEDGSDSPAIKIEIPVRYFVSESSLPYYGSLPNGDPLPALANFETRGLILPLIPGSWKVHLFFESNGVAAFIERNSVPEIPYLPVYMGYPVRNAQSKISGWFALYSREGDQSAGYYVASRFSNETATMIRELIAQSK